MDLSHNLCCYYLGFSLVCNHIFWMKRSLLNPVFLVCVFLAIVNQILEKGFGVFVPFIHSYLDDFLCFPIVLTLGLAVYRFTYPEYRLNRWHIIPTFIVYSVYFEMYLPQTSSAYTSDFYDLIAYLCGLTVFGYFINYNDAVGLKRTKIDLR